MNQEHIDYLLTCEGWCTEEKMKRLYSLVEQTAIEFKGQPLLSVELGVFAGRSFFPMALAHKKLVRGTAIGIDSWDNIAPLEGTNSKANNDWWANLPIKNMLNNYLASSQHLEIGDYVKHYEGKSEVFVNEFADESITLLHQDSNHNVETITKELELYAPKIKPGGYWVADDTDWVETKSGYAKLPSFGFDLIENHFKWQIWRKRIAGKAKTK